MSYMGIQELKDADLKSGSATGDGSTTTFAIGWTPPSEQSLFVTINGVLQSASALSLSGANCVFTAAPASGDAIEFKGIQSSGTVVTTTGDGTIDAAKLADNAVTSAKILADAVTNVKMADDSVGIAELSATGTAQAGTYLQGDNTWGAIATAGFEKYTVVTSTNATFGLTSGVTKVIVEVQASGGTAGNGTPTGYNGGSGGGGAYARKLLTGMTGATDQLNITIGAVPAAATAGTTTSVAAAGTASFTTITCAGGAGGTTAVAPTQGTGGAGGTLPTTGDFNIAGGGGMSGAVGHSNTAGGSWLSYPNGRMVDTGGIGMVPIGYGGGGNAAYGGGYNGGAGGPAVVIVWEYK